MGGSFIFPILSASTVELCLCACVGCWSSSNSAAFTAYCLSGNPDMLCCRIHNADIHLTEDYDLDDLVDVIEGSRVYIPAIYVVNKIDQITLEELEVMDKLPHYCPVRAMGT